MKKQNKTGWFRAVGRVSAAVAMVAVAAPAASATTPAHEIRTGPVQVVHQPNSLTLPGNVKTTNWAGYADRGHRFTAVSASWIQPRVTCTSTEAIASFWVGLDGYHSKNVEQAGSLAWCHGGKVTYYTWWQMYPSTDIQLVGSTVRPGDRITASVSSIGHSYSLKVTDSTSTSNSFSKSASCATCDNASAEWIAERPSGSGGGLYPLAKFGHVQFYAAHVAVGSDSGPISTFAHDTLIMINHAGQTMASVSPLKAGGRQFVATWLRGQ